MLTYSIVSLFSNLWGTRVCFSQHLAFCWLSSTQNFKCSQKQVIFILLLFVLIHFFILTIFCLALFDWPPFSTDQRISRIYLMRNGISLQRPRALTCWDIRGYLIFRYIWFITKTAKEISSWRFFIVLSSPIHAPPCNPHQQLSHLKSFLQRTFTVWKTPHLYAPVLASHNCPFFLNNKSRKLLFWFKQSEMMTRDPSKSPNPRHYKYRSLQPTLMSKSRRLVSDRMWVRKAAVEIVKLFEQI